MMQFTLRELIACCIAASALLGMCMQGYYVREITETRYGAIFRDKENEWQRKYDAAHRFYKEKMKAAGIQEPEKFLYTGMSTSGDIRFLSSPNLGDKE